MAMNVNVRYLSQSSFTVELENTVLIFDYYGDTYETSSESLNKGIINISELKNKRVLVFTSHRHPDHFNPVIFAWKNELENVRYYLSSDIPKRYHREEIHLLKPYQNYEDDWVKIRTLKSTDAGVAFLVSIFDLSIYHAGDLNWWHWDEESKAYNNNMAARFKHEISLLKDDKIDIALLTTDPRQESAELKGLNWFLDNVDVKTVFPMHFWDDYSIMDRIKEKAQEKPALKKVRLISNRGQEFILLAI